MIVQCEKCNARYNVPDGSIGTEGITVRCARCSHSWFERAGHDTKTDVTTDSLPHAGNPADVSSPTENAVTESAASENTNENTANVDNNTISISPSIRPISSTPQMQSYRRKVPLGLKVAVASLLLLVSGLSLFMTMPKLFGISPSKGLVLADMNVQKRSDDKTNYVEISGNILNESEEPLVVPKIRIILLDGADNPLQSWEFKSNGETLKPRETLPFTSGNLNMKFSIAKRFVVDMGTPLELALRRKP